MWAKKRSHPPLDDMDTESCMTLFEMDLQLNYIAEKQIGLIRGIGLNVEKEE